MENEEQLSAEEKAASAAFEKAFGPESPPQLPARDPATGQFQAADKVPAKEPKETRKPELQAKTAKEAPEPKPAAKPFAITQEQWDAYTRDLEALKSERGKLNGTVGNLQQLVSQFRSATPQGVQIELPPELEQEFPELAAHLKKAKIRGTATAPASDAKPSVTDEEIKRLIAEASENAQKDVDAKLRAARQKVEAEALDDLHPDWREIVGAGETPDPNNAYRIWLKGEPAEYQKLINETDSASVIARSIDRFKAAAKAQPANGAKQPNPVTDRRRAAIQPKGDGGQPGAPSKNDAEALMQRAFDS